MICEYVDQSTPQGCWPIVGLTAEITSHVITHTTSDYVVSRHTKGWLSQQVRGRRVKLSKRGRLSLSGTAHSRGQWVPALRVWGGEIVLQIEELE